MNIETAFHAAESDSFGACNKCGVVADHACEPDYSEPCHCGGLVLGVAYLIFSPLGERIILEHYGEE